jgi:hypothetical protein
VSVTHKVVDEATPPSRCGSFFPTDAYHHKDEFVTCGECLRWTIGDLKEKINGLTLDLEHERNKQQAKVETVHSRLYPCENMGSVRTDDHNAITCLDCLRKWALAHFSLYERMRRRCENLPDDDDVMGLLTAHESHVWRLVEAISQFSLSVSGDSRGERLSAKVHKRRERLTKERDKLIRRLCGESEE